jgi:hypothetical protein
MSRHLVILCFMVSMAIVTVGYALGENQKIQPQDAGEFEDVIAFEGRVVYLNFEGGFWGIVCSDGRKYDPLGLPPKFQMDGLRVRGKLRPRSNLMSFHMWGTIVEVLEISVIDEPGCYPTQDSNG